MFRIAGAALLSIVLVACGGSDTPASESTPADTSDSTVALSPPQPYADRADDSVTVESRDRAIYAEYAKLVVDVSTREADSLAKAIMAKGLKPDKMMAEMEKGMKRLRARKEEAIRENLAHRFALPLDSVNAILLRKDAERERTMESRREAEAANDTGDIPVVQ